MWLAKQRKMHKQENTSTEGGVGARLSLNTYQWLLGIERMLPAIINVNGEASKMVNHVGPVVERGKQQDFSLLDGVARVSSWARGRMTFYLQKGRGPAISRRFASVISQ